ncbi:hypothetical protein ID0086_13000 [Helicobacter pylori]
MISQENTMISQENTMISQENTMISQENTMISQENTNPYWQKKQTLKRPFGKGVLIVKKKPFF